jgi:hypothetical protein
MKFIKFILIALLIFPSPLLASDQIKRTGIFSSFEFHDETSDINGLEVFIVYSRDGYFASIQGAEGVPGKPVVIPVQISGNTLSFTIPESDGYIGYWGEFTGMIKKDGLYLKVKGISQQLFLPRRVSYWQ